MPSLDIAKIETIFIDKKEQELDTQNPLFNIHLNTDEKVRRKRVLISSDFKSAYKVKNIFDVYFELN